jgi:hypothetical protein
LSFFFACPRRKDYGQREQFAQQPLSVEKAWVNFPEPRAVCGAPVGILAGADKYGLPLQKKVA